MLSESKPHQNKLDEMLVACLTLQKLYGRDVANTETVIELFQKIMGKYPADKVIRAFEIWMERSQEFPTPSDIVNLIKRNGRPPLSKERYIAISKKDGEDRTQDDWQYMREYDKEQDTEEMGSEYVDETKESATLQENIRLRTEVRELKAEYARLADMLREERKHKALPKPEISLVDKVQRTIEMMRTEGAAQEDIDEFLRQYGAAA